VGTPAVALWLIALAAMSAAAMQDLRFRLIPNIFVLVVLCAAIGLRIIAGLQAIGLSMVATAIVCGAAYILADRGYVGWGDGKMIAAASLLVPPQTVTELILSIAVAGGILSLLYLAARIALRHGTRFRHPATGPQPMTEAFRALIRGEKTRIAAHEPMPYGVAILGGTAYWLFARVMQCCCATHCLS
jgi:prepilin peptidase CpaA